MNTLPFDIIEILNEKVHYMNMREFVLPELEKQSPRLIFTNEVLPKLAGFSPLFIHTMCYACVYNSATCVSCAQYDHKFKNGPGYACGKRMVIDDGDIDEESYANLIMWQLMTAKEFESVTIDEYALRIFANV